MTGKNLAVLILSICWHVYSVAQPTFLNTYGEPGASVFSGWGSMAVLTDGRIALGGMRGIINFAPGAYVVIGPEGDLLTAKYQTEEDFNARYILGAGKVGELLTGFYFIEPSTSRKSLVSKTTANGQSVWLNEYRSDGDGLLSVTRIESVNGGYLLTGNIVFPVAASQMAMLKIDENGAPLWQFSLSWYGEFVKALQLSDGHVLAIGNSISGAHVAKISPAGELVSLKLLPDITFLDAESTPEDAILVTATSNEKAMLLKFAPDVSLHWAKITDQSAYFPRIEATADGHYWLLNSGFSSQGGAGLFKMDEAGEILPGKRYLLDEKYDFWLGNMRTHPQGGVVLAGEAKDAPNGKRRMVVLRADEAGHLKTCCRELTDSVKLVDTQVIVENFSQPPGVLLEAGPVDVSLADFILQQEQHCATNLDFALSDTLICPGQCVTIEFPQPTSGVDYQWFFENGQPAESDAAQPGPVCFPMASGGGAVIRLLADGCLEKRDTLIFGNPDGLFPNAFSPDGDSHNDSFRPRIDCPVDDYFFQVYDRWGKRIFESEDFSAAWDGRADNGMEAPVDVYLWQVRYTIAERVYLHSGEVTLLR